MPVWSSGIESTIRLVYLACFNIDCVEGTHWGPLAGCNRAIIAQSLAALPGICALVNVRNLSFSWRQHLVIFFAPPWWISLFISKSITSEVFPQTRKLQIFTSLRLDESLAVTHRSQNPHPFYGSRSPASV